MAIDRGALAALFRQRLIVCVGAGGVGKTTTAAALGVAAASSGYSTAVITVDPSRRLKDALGLDALSTRPRPVALGNGAAPLDALALDTKRTFDELIGRFAPSPAIAQRILANRLYQELSSELGGSTEYMAMETLHALLQEQRYDLIIVDTPPSADVRELLSAPLRMTELLASQAIDFLKAPTGIITGSESRLMRMTLGAVLKALERWTGLTLLRELSDFVAGFEHLVEGFRARARATEEALRGADASFVIVATAETATISATRAFDRELRAGGFPIAGIIANRVYDFAPLAAHAGRQAPPALRAKLIENYADFAALAARDRTTLDALQRETGTPLLAAVPILEEAPASIAGLRRIAALLHAGPESTWQRRSGGPRSARPS
jgi:anion-transporting  ArsA/GET3 family ATPase